MGLFNCMLWNLAESFQPIFIKQKGLFDFKLFLR